MILIEIFISGFFDNWFSINHNKSHYRLKVTKYTSKFSILSLVSENIVFVIFYHLFLSDFTKSQSLVKVKALTLTFDFSSSNIF